MTARMQRWISVLAPGLALVCGLIFVAQTPTPFPQTLPANSVVGRLGAGVPGPAEAIPFATLQAQMFGSLSTVSFTSLGIGCAAGTNGIIVCNAVPVTSGNGQAVIGSSTTLGGIYGGQGSGFDLILQNKNAASVCSIATGSTTITCANLALSNVLPPGSGGTNNAFFGVSGPASTIKTFTFPNASATIPQTIAAGQKALATSLIGSGACTAAQTATATGTLTTDVIQVAFAADPTAVTGYVPLSTGMLTIIYYPTADTVNFKVCNNTGSGITPGAVTLNWAVHR